MNSISRHRLRRSSKQVSPGGKSICSCNQMFGEQADKKLSMQPGACTRRIFFRQMSKAQDRLHSLKGQFDLPAQTVRFKNLIRLELVGQARPYREILGTSP